MGLRLAQWLRAPTFADDERTRVAGLLHIVFCVSLGLLAGIFGIRVGVTGFIGHWWFYPSASGLLLGGLLALRRGWVYSSGVAVILGLLAYAIAGALVSGGLGSPALQVLVIVVVFTALLGRSRLILGATALTLGALVTIALLDLRGTLPPASVELTSTSIFFGEFVSLAVLGLALTLIIVSLKDALARARAQERAAAEMAVVAEDARVLTDEVIAAMPESVVVVDTAAMIRSVNPATVALLGWPEEALRGAPFSRILASEGGATDPLEELLRRPQVHRESAYRARDGQEVAVRFSSALLRGDGGALRGVVCVASDIRRDKELAEELRRAKELAEEASVAKSRFLANMSHELRTPLNAVIGYTELLLEEASERGLGGSVDDLQRIQGAGKHLLGLISDILDLSKVEAGKMELHLETFAVNDMITAVLDTVRPLIDAKGLCLRTAVPEGLGYIHADQTKIRQILINLLGNAAKFTPRGEIRFAARQGHREGLEWLQLMVRDTGIGMSDSQIGALFQAFSQPDPMVARRHGGTGLGLALSRAFAEMMGGSIAVRSEVGKGSVFTVEVPYIDPTLVSQSGWASPELVAHSLGIDDAAALLPRRRPLP